MPIRKLKLRHLNTAPRLRCWRRHHTSWPVRLLPLNLSPLRAIASLLLSYDILLGSCLSPSKGNIHFLDESVVIKHLGSAAAAPLIILTLDPFIPLQLMKSFHVHHITDRGHETPRGSSSYYPDHTDEEAEGSGRVRDFGRSCI